MGKRKITEEMLKGISEYTKTHSWLEAQAFFHCSPNTVKMALENYPQAPKYDLTDLWKIAQARERLETILDGIPETEYSNSTLEKQRKKLIELRNILRIQD